MSRWVKIAKESDLNGDVTVFDINGKAVALFRLEDGYYAIDDTCSHEEAFLSEGEIEDGKVECPLHGAEFDLKTGEALTLPATKPVTVFTTEIDGDSLVIKENLDA